MRTCLILSLLALLSKLAIREVDPTSLMANLDKSGVEPGRR